MGLDKFRWKMAPANSSCSPAFLYKNDTKFIPLTYLVFLSKLKRSLSVFGINNTLYSRHSFRRGGAKLTIGLGNRLSTVYMQNSTNMTVNQGHNSWWGSTRLEHSIRLFPSELIQSHGDWKSDTYKKYLVPSFQHRQLVMNGFAQALCKAWICL
jgi:hypothetical protein